MHGKSLPEMVKCKHVNEFGPQESKFINMLVPAEEKREERSFVGDYYGQWEGEKGSSPRRSLLSSFLEVSWDYLDKKTLKEGSLLATLC